MTTEAGDAKGLKQMLEECRFNIEKMKAKYSPFAPSIVKDAAWLDF